MNQLVGRVCGVRRGGDARQTVSRPGKGQGVNLIELMRLARSDQFGHGRIITVFTVNTPTTLSHSVPAFGCQSNSFDNALARYSMRSLTSSAEYSVPVRPHVNGGLESLRG